MRPRPEEPDGSVRRYRVGDGHSSRFATGGFTLRLAASARLPLDDVGLIAAGRAPFPSRARRRASRDRLLTAAAAGEAALKREHRPGHISLKAPMCGPSSTVPSCSRPLLFGHTCSAGRNRGLAMPGSLHSRWCSPHGR
jgi:hypothetical protein